MKNYYFLIILSVFLFISCAPAVDQNKTSVVSEGKQIESLKGLIASFTAGDWEGYRSHFTEEANVVHNLWWNAEGAAISIDEMLTQHQWNRENLFATLSVNEGIYEIITQENGSQFGHVWIEFTSRGYDNEEEIKIPVNLSYAMEGEKVSFEWGFYDTSKFPAPKKEE